MSAIISIFIAVLALCSRVQKESSFYSHYCYYLWGHYLLSMFTGWHSQSYLPSDPSFCLSHCLIRQQTDRSDQLDFQFHILSSWLGYFSFETNMPHNKFLALVEDHWSPPKHHSCRWDRCPKNCCNMVSIFISYASWFVSFFFLTSRNLQICGSVLRTDCWVVYGSWPACKG